MPKSAVAVAIRHLTNHWSAFVRYTEDGRLSPDNNLSERTLRLIAVGRSNWKFVGSAQAGERAAVHYSLVGTCRHLGLDAAAYLRDVLPALVKAGELHMYRHRGFFKSMDSYKDQQELEELVQSGAAQWPM